MHVDQRMLDIVGFLCVDMAVAPGVVKQAPVGTGFFVTVEEDGFGQAYLVTAKHVHRDLMKSPKAYIRLNGDTPAEDAEHSVLGSDWRFHNDPAVDLAVLAITGPLQGAYNSLGFNDVIAAPDELRKANWSWPPGVGEQLIYAGLLAQYSGHRRTFPIVRMGHMALVTDEKIEGEYGPSHYHLADLQTFPGHSGGPVWFVAGYMYLVGVMAAGYLADQDQFIQKQQIGTALHTTTIETYARLGISLITPVEKLQELLMSDELKKERRERMKTIGHNISGGPVATG
jgi:S1-C subfamily serine protease